MFISTLYEHLSHSTDHIYYSCEPAGSYSEIENDFECNSVRLVFGLYLQDESYSKDHAGYTADPEPNQKQQLPARGFHYKHLCNGNTHL